MKSQTPGYGRQLHSHGVPTAAHHHCRVMLNGIRKPAEG